MPLGVMPSGHRLFSLKIRRGVWGEQAPGVSQGSLSSPRGSQGTPGNHGLLGTVVLQERVDDLLCDDSSKARDDH